MVRRQLIIDNPDEEDYDDDNDKEEDNCLNADEFEPIVDDVSTHSGGSSAVQVEDSRASDKANDVRTPATKKACYSNPK